MVALNDTVFDQQTQTNVELNDLSIGQYDVVCDFGPAFNSQQKDTAQAFLDMAAIDPTILQQGMDIHLKNLNVPGMEQMAERIRIQLLQSGAIPESQWTDEERQQIEQQQAQQQQQPPQEDPNMVIARAEELKGQAAMTSAQNKQAEIQGNQQISMQQLELENKKVDLDTQKFIKGQDDKFNESAANIDQGQQKIDQAQYKMMNDFSLKLTELEQKYQTQLNAELSQNTLMFDPSTGNFVNATR
jgi:hypothetical protein